MIDALGTCWNVCALSRLGMLLNQELMGTFRESYYTTSPGARLVPPFIVTRHAITRGKEAASNLVSTILTFADNHIFVETLV